MNAETAVEWVTIASYCGLSAEVEADLLVTNLQGADIPAERLPKQPLGMFVTKVCVPSIIPIQVMVPPDRETEARELLAEQPRQTVPRGVRSVVRWFLAVSVVGAIASGPLSRSVSTTGLLAILGMGLSIICGVMLIVSELRLAATVQRERPTRPAVGTVAVTIMLVGGICFLLLYPLNIVNEGKPPTPDSDSMTAMVLVGYTALAALLLRQARLRRTDDSE